MSFFIGPLIRVFLLEQACNQVAQELHARVSEHKTVRLNDQPLDFAILFSNKAEMVGLLDRCGRTTMTTGNGTTFYQTDFSGKKTLLAHIGEKETNGVTETVIDVFRPKRILVAGFGTALNAKIEKNALFIPNRVIDGVSGEIIDFWQKNLLEGSVESKSDVFQMEIDCKQNHLNDT